MAAQAAGVLPRAAAQPSREGAVVALSPPRAQPPHAIIVFHFQNPFVQFTIAFEGVQVVP